MKRGEKEMMTVYSLLSSVPLLTFPSPLHSPRRARSVGDGDGKGNRMSTEPDPTTDGTKNIIIKTTYDISLDFQDSLLPLGFLSLSRVRSSSLTLRSFHSPRRAGE